MDELTIGHLQAQNRLNPRRAIRKLIPDSVIGRARDLRQRWRTRQGRRLIRLEQVNFQSLLEKPPAIDSPQAQAELLEIQRLQQTVTPADLQQAAREAYVSPAFFAEVLGPRFSLRTLPRTFAFLQELMWADAAVVEPIKYFFARKRPYEIDPRLLPSVPLDPTPGYPSGHAARLLILASTLGQLFPSRRESLLQLAADIPARRVRIGLHFPTDIEAGKLLGSFIYKTMLESPAFKSRLTQAERECHTLDLQSD